MKLKPIPTNTVVHTPTEAEAKELLQMLHENGYKWCDNKLLTSRMRWDDHENQTCYHLHHSVVQFSGKEWFERNGATILTLAEFKRIYCEEEKPRETDIDGKFHCGDKVITTAFCPLYGKGWVGTVVQCHESDVDVTFGLRVIPHVALCDLEPYTEPETKPTEDMETKDESKDESKELNLCELLKGHEGEAFYSPQFGWVELVAGNPSLYPNTIATTIPGTSGLAYYLPNGKYLKSDSSACVSLFPSRALYEQYPLDPLKAWSVWQEEQKKHWLSVTAWIDNLECESDTTIDTDKIYFRTSADRDKCIEEINAVINKYSK